MSASIDHASHPARKTRLLVVDDDLVQRKVIAKVGAQAGHDVVEADSVARATAILTAGGVDCITIDLSLGEEYGAELLEVIARGRRIPVVIISGMSERALLSSSRLGRQLNLDVHAAFPKPIDLAALRLSLATLARPDAA